MPATTFAQFYVSWYDQFTRLINQLTTPNQTDTNELIRKVMSHHENYFKAKSKAAEKDPLHVLASPWASTLERSLHWIAGWRPTTAFHLIYTESSLLFESHIIDILHGLRTGDLGDLSPTQFRRVSDLQCDTVKEENAITEELSEWQDSASDMMGSEAEVNDKIQRLVSIIKKADELRLRTLRNVVEFLSPQQAIEFLIASAELLVGIRGWGLNHDRSLPRI
ncbi:protein DOG1-like 4 [Vicia villosa]|uniref:protein DOG1-like 4 n=1 Tax=Vicia villosa TaxID=3911 RepID=UPI00273C6298|nr:protein DOG1-like 4 [Vicia villosa]